MRNLPLLSAATALVLTAACGKTAQVRASLTDAPIDNVTVFNVTIDEVRFHLDNDEVENENESKDPSATHKDADDDGARGKGWVVLCTGSQTFDLMKLRPAPTGEKVWSALCGGATVTVPAGRVDKFWLDVTQVHIELASGAKLDFTPAHGTNSGLKIEIDEDASKGGERELKIDFDAASSRIANLDGSFSVKPKLLALH